MLVQKNRWRKSKNQKIKNINKKIRTNINVFNENVVLIVSLIIVTCNNVK